MKHPILYVIAVISNPVGYKSRYKLYKEFETKLLRNPHVRLLTVEHAFGDREHEVTQPFNPFHLQLRGGADQEIWIKEGLINAGIRHLTKIDPDWKYVAWIDADVEFTKDDWAESTIRALEHFSVVQPWSHAIDFGPQGQPVGDDTSFCFDWFNGRARGKQYGGTWHPGYAWAMTRRAWESLAPVGGLMDFGILGASDHHLAWAFIGEIEKGVHGKMCDDYKEMCWEYQNAVNKVIALDVGYVDGTLLHKWHGSKKRRYYVERWDILVKNEFNPKTDLGRDEHGVPKLISNNPKLRHDIRKYLRSRQEDGTEL